MELDGGAPGLPSPAAEPSASYLARCLVADRGFRVGSFPEARPLAEGCDVILTASDGLSTTIACIVDCDAAPERRFARSAEETAAAATACRVHVASVYGARVPLAVEIWEVGRGLPGPGDRERLAALTFRRGGKAPIAIAAMAVDSESGALFATIPARDQRRHQAWLTSLFAGPRRGRDDTRADPRVGFVRRRPVATVALLVTLLAIFAGEVLLSPAMTGFLSPPLDVLIGLGGLDHRRVADGELWRALTAAFLHGSLLHLVFNGVALFLAGAVLESLVGRVWMLALFVVGALGGSAASMIGNPSNIVSVGASGAIMGMLAAALVIVLRLPRGPGRTAMVVSLAQILVPSLLPLANTLGDGARVDIAAHIGGAITGAMAGLLLLLTWAPRSVTPRGRWIGRALVGAGAVMLAMGGLGVARTWEENGPTQLLAPDSVVAPIELGELTRERAAELVAAYPRDPRVNLFAGHAAIQVDAFQDARGFLEAALAEPALIRRLTRDGVPVEVWIRELLGLTHFLQGDPASAHKTIEPICGSTAPSIVREGARAELCALR